MIRKSMLFIDLQMIVQCIDNHLARGLHNNDIFIVRKHTIIIINSKVDVAALVKL